MAFNDVSNVFLHFNSSVSIGCKFCCGYYNTSNGSKYNQGTNGYWLSSEGNRWKLNYNNTSLDQYGRDSDGYSVRCVGNLTGRL